MLSEFLEKLNRDLKDLSSDVQTMIQEEEKESNQSENDGNKKVFSNKKLKSLQQLTTFYDSKEEAEKMSEEDPIIAFINKRMKEIFEG
jgi:hypothetical protein